MENRYLYRAKRIDNGEWVEGALVYDNADEMYRIITEIHYSTGTCIIAEKAPRIDESTICQCTGLKGKNGELIWEKDMVKDLFSDTAAPISYGSYKSCFDSSPTEHVGFYVDWSDTRCKNYRKDLGYWINMVDAEVVGNTIDNPELLTKLNFGG